jgi:polysaccharide export outer membrane protein
MEQGEMLKPCSAPALPPALRPALPPTIHSGRDTRTGLLNFFRFFRPSLWISRLPLPLLIGVGLLQFAPLTVFAQNVHVARQSLPLRAMPQRISERIPQQKPATDATATNAPDEETRIGADDVLDISVFNAPELDRTVRVSGSGEISAQLLGTVRAAGLTARELELVLQELLRHTYMKDPHVGVFVRELHSHAITVVGAVKSPGVFQIRGSKSVLELISMAQGLTDDAGETAIVQRGSAAEVRADGQKPAPQNGTSAGENPTTEINLKRLMESQDSAMNIAVHPGDILKVSRAGIVYVVGAGVRTPGGFILKNNEPMSVLQAVALAQGFTRTSSKSHAMIIRTDPQTNQRTEIALDLGKVLSSKQADPLLQARDVVYVPDSSAKNVMYRGAEAALSTATGVAIYRW